MLAEESKTVNRVSGICQTDSSECMLAGTLARIQKNLFDIYLKLYLQS